MGLWVTFLLTVVRFTLPGETGCPLVGGDPCSPCGQHYAITQPGEVALVLWNGSAFTDTVARHSVSAWGSRDSFSAALPAQWVAIVATRQGKGPWSCSSNHATSGNWPVGVDPWPSPEWPLVQLEWFDVAGRKVAPADLVKGRAYFQRAISARGIVTRTIVIVR